jgi:hypothetical protein
MNQEAQDVIERLQRALDSASAYLDRNLEWANQVRQNWGWPPPMSLDVYLSFPGGIAAEPRNAILMRLDGTTVEVSRSEWEELNPGLEPVTVMVGGEARKDVVYSANVTHNLWKMAGEAGIYQALWRPEEIGIKTAHDLIGFLSQGLAVLKSDPERFKAFNPANEWGDYEGLVQFTQDYLNACAKWPEATVSVWR